MVPDITTLSIANIDNAISPMSMAELTILWQNAMDYRNALPGGGGSVRGNEVTRMLDDHIIPMYQAYQGIDVIAFRANNYTTNPVADNAPLNAAMVAIVSRILNSGRAQQSLTSPNPSNYTPQQQSIHDAYVPSITRGYAVAVAHTNAASTLYDALVAAGDISAALQESFFFMEQLPNDPYVATAANQCAALYALRASLAAKYPQNIRMYDIPFNASGIPGSIPKAMSADYNPMTEGGYHPNVTEQQQALQTQGQSASATLIVAQNQTAGIPLEVNISTPSPAVVAAQASNVATDAAAQYMAQLQGGGSDSSAALQAAQVSAAAADSAAAHAGSVVAGLNPKLIGYAVAAIAALLLLRK
jgi:hypothetical protein